MQVSLTRTSSKTFLFIKDFHFAKYVAGFACIDYSVVEIDGPDSAIRPIDKDRVKNAKQFTWVLILKANRAVGCVAWLGHILWALLGAIKKRLFFRNGVAMENENEKSGKGKFLFRFILSLLLTAMAFLAFEVIAHYMRWPYFQEHNLHIPQTLEIRGWLHSIYVSWLGFRADYIAPLILSFSNFCVVLFLIQYGRKPSFQLGLSATYPYSCHF